MSLARILRFAVVGTVNTAVYYAIYLALRLVVPYLVAHVLAFLVAMVGSYFLNCYVTFHTRPHWRSFLLFPLSNAANFVITTVGMRLVVGGLGVDERVAPIPVALVAIPVTYVVAHHIMLGRLTDPYREEIEREAAEIPRGG